MKIVWFSEIQWNYLKTRKQQIISHFPEDWEILFIEPYVAGKPSAFLPRQSGRVIHVTVPYFKSTPYRWINALQNFAPLRWFYQLLIYGWIVWILRRTNFNTPERVICVSNVLYIPIIRRLKRRLLVYDCNDIPMGFSASLRFLATRFSQTLHHSDGIVTVSGKLAENILKIGNRKSKIIGNGVSEEFFTVTNETPNDIAATPKPRLLYAGALADWFDSDLILKIADTYPQCSVVLIGPFLSNVLKNKITDSGKKNIYILGEKKFNALPAYYRASHVCLIPFIKNELTNGLNPNKLYEYLACGKPVVTKDYSDEINKLADILFIAKDNDSFLELIRVALDHPPPPEQLQSVARQNTWKIKSKEFADYVLQLDNQKLPQKNNH